MITVWSWLAVAGLGALHGLSPANGWLFAAARGVHARNATHVHRTLLPIACGHSVAIAIGVLAVAAGLLPDRILVQRLAGVALIGAAAYQAWRHGAARGRAQATVGLRTAPASQLAIALWSGTMAVAHGAGLMLVPALLPLCMSDTPARAISASGSLILGLAAVGLHLATMLVTTAAVASGVCHGFGRWAPRLAAGRLSQCWTLGLAGTGMLLWLLH